MGIVPRPGGPIHVGGGEEFHVALECLRDATSPMQQVVVFFKAVDEKQLSDPGPQLQAVLRFKKSLEDSKEHLYHTFDEIRSFEHLLSKHLAEWLFAHEKGQTLKRSPVAITPSTEVDLSGSRTVTVAPPEPSEEQDELLEEVKELTEQGRRTEAEALFARAIVRGAGPEVLIAYGQFLKRDGRLMQAIEMYQRAVEVADASNNDAAGAAARRNLGNVLRIRGDLDGAEEMYRKSLEIEERLGRLEGMASDYGNLGIVLYTRGDLDGARRAWERAVDLYSRIGAEQRASRIRDRLSKIEGDPDTGSN